MPSSRVSVSSRGGGRVLPHQRQTNDAAPIIGRGGDGGMVLPAINDILANAVHDTISQGMNDGTRRNYRNRLAKIIEYLKKQVPLYHAIGVRTLTDDEISDRTKYYFGKKHDLIYTGLNVEYSLLAL